MNQTKGFVLLSDVRTIAQIATGPIHILPTILRLIRTGLADNGFCGVRTLTAKKQFLKDASGDPQFAEALADVQTFEDGEKSLDVIIAALEEKHYLIVSPGDSAKYIVCHPRHDWIVTTRDGIVYAATAKSDTWKKTLAKLDVPVLETTFASFV